MGKSITIDSDLTRIKKQIKLQKQGPILFPFVALLFIMMCINEFNGRDRFVILTFFLLYAAFLFIYSPVSKAILLGKVFYKMEILKENTILFTSFGTLWRKEKIVQVQLLEINIDKIPLPKLLYKQYLLNAIYIDNKRYYIFNQLLIKSKII